MDSSRPNPIDAFGSKTFKDLIKVNKPGIPNSPRSEESKMNILAMMAKRKALGLSQSPNGIESTIKNVFRLNNSPVNIFESNRLVVNRSRRGSESVMSFESSNSKSSKVDITKLQSKVRELHNGIVSSAKNSPKYQINIETVNSINESIKESITANSLLEDKVGNASSVNAQSLIRENEAILRMEMLQKQLESEKYNKQLFEELYNKEINVSKQLEEINQSLAVEMNIIKSSSEIQKTRLLNEIKSLKLQNLDLQTQLRQKNQQHIEYSHHTMLKKSATRISENSLELMEKSELLSQFNNLKAEYSHSSKQILKQADDLFEKNTEIKQLNSQKNEILKELNIYKSQVDEIYILKEHVAYLLSSLQSMRMELTNIAEKYKEILKNTEDATNSTEIIESISNIANKAKSKIDTITDKSKHPMQGWMNIKKKKGIIQVLQQSIISIINKELI